MVVKPDYILNLEKTQDNFSIMKFHRFRDQIIKYLDEKSLKRVFEVSRVVLNGKAKWEEIIYITKQNFYIYVYDLNEEDNSLNLNIYYKAEQRKELLFFTNQILKPFIDGTTDNTTT